MHRQNKQSSVNSKMKVLALFHLRKKGARSCSVSVRKPSADFGTAAAAAMVDCGDGLH